MQKLFILGTGFSKAVSCKMPTMKELGEHLESKIKMLSDGDRIHGIYKGLSPDPKNPDCERLLTYLFQAMPWKSPAEVKRDKAAFIEISSLIVDYIIDCEEEAFEKNPEPWTAQFVEYLHNEQSTVATFNYDTVLERLSSDLEKLEDDPHFTHGRRVTTFSIYKAPIAHLHMRTASGAFLTNGDDYAQTYRLLKLHGSVNWYFPGDENVPGQQVYAIEVHGKSPRKQLDSESAKRNGRDLVPLIIPPVAEKTVFYGTTFVGKQWQEFRQAIRDAEEIYCVGYSLPKTDLTTGLFFSTVMNKCGKKVYIVNLETDSDDLIENYEQAIPNCELKKDYISDNKPIEQMVKDLQ